MDDDSVGYGKPPRKSRFRRGRSGNPQGRPKGTFAPGTILAKALKEKVVVQENGKRKTITKLQAIMKQAVNRAATGDPKATQQLINLFRIFGDQIGPEADSTLTPVVVQIVGVESDGNGRPKVVEGIVETDEDGNFSGDLELHQRNRS